MDLLDGGSLGSSSDEGVQLGCTAARQVVNVAGGGVSAGKVELEDKLRVGQTGWLWEDERSA
jgi:hypothetical protein